MRPLVSVLMTAYNREKYIAEAIESILESTLTDWELIVVDDNSSDKTLSIAQGYAQNDSRIKVFKNEENLGDYPNRNKAASYATGKYLKYVDSDDKIYPNTLGIMVEAMNHYPEAGVGLCFDETAGLAKPITLLNARDAYICHYFQQPIFFASPGQAIFRKSAFAAVGGFLGKRMVGDFEMWHKMALRFPLTLIPGNLYWVRRHKGQEVSVQHRYILDYERIKLQYLQAETSPLTIREAETVFKNRQLTVAKIFFRKLVCLQWGGAYLRAKVFFFYFFLRKKQQIHD